ncbi:hypothetical protein GCM10009720_09010 [Yaniella flava]|uniref:Uncharacterized protein n=1 Tax=Yaniella flava TaxID=287930 RepID=A0ABN2U876_9MICC
MTTPLAKRHSASRIAPPHTHKKTDAKNLLREFIDPIMGEFDLDAADELYEFANQSWDFTTLGDELITNKIMDHRKSAYGESRWSDGVWIAPNTGQVA